MVPSSGQQAENVAAQYLKNLGYVVLGQNWRTRYCEIDIIARKARTVYFIEVKYRRNRNQGLGYEYITAKKSRQMRFAAEMWVHHTHWSGDYQILGVSVDDTQIQLFEV